MSAAGERQAALAALLAAAKRAGADAADAVWVDSESLSVTRRLGKIEQLERSESRDIGLRVFVGRAVAAVSSNAAERDGLDALAARAVAMARVVPEDRFAGLAETVTPPDDAGALELDDGATPDVAALLARAAAAEEAVLATPGITNSDGAEAGHSRTTACLATSAGFFGEVTRGGHSVSVTAMAGSGTEMQRDYDFHAAAFAADLEDPEALGRNAAARALRRLNPTRPRTASLPVVFDPRVAGSLVSHLAGAVNGAAIARGTSFLKDRMGDQIFPTGVTIIDDPRRRRGMRSRTYDGEGVPTAPRALVKDGSLASWLLDWRSARQLGLASTGHAARATTGGPSPSATNLYMCAGTESADALIGAVTLGIYVTELMGMGVNLLTGDYSRGASGFMIRDGRIAEPVAEFTIAGTLPEMWRDLAAADDLTFRHGTDAPTLRVARMTIAGA